MSLLCEVGGVRQGTVEGRQTHCRPANSVLHITRMMFGWFYLPQLREKGTDSTHYSHQSAYLLEAQAVRLRLAILT